MLNKYTNKGGKRLRYGYTTGSCAAAAAKAASLMLLSQEVIKFVSLKTPKGWELELSIYDVKITKSSVSCAVIKDSGDDPDITNGIKVYATVRHNTGYKIISGEGVGVVTKKGLAVAVGEPAINPVPRQMILDEVSQILTQGALVKISVPQGAEIAQRTFNPKLGIVGGISILGTTGIVEPMSQDALKESLALELNVKIEAGHNRLVYVPGNYGFNYAKLLHISEDKVLKTSNFIGFLLDKAEELGVKKLLLIGHIGKLIKVAGGIFQTHSKYADARMEILAAYCACLGANASLVNELLNCITTEEAVDLIIANKLSNVFDLIADRVALRSTQRAHNEIKIEAIIFSQAKGLLGKSLNADSFLKEFNNA